VIPFIQLSRFSIWCGLGIKILYNYLFEFEKIRAGNCERPLMRFI